MGGQRVSPVYLNAAIQTTKNTKDTKKKDFS